MARLIPSDFDPLGPDAPHPAEARTLARLAQALSDRHTIYHGVHWARSDASASVFGEIDFIVVNPWGRLLAIEQKDAPVSVQADDLIVRYKGAPAVPDGRRDAPRGGGKAIGSLPSERSILTQVQRNLHGLRSQFARRHPGRALDVDYLLYLPLSQVRGVLPSSIDAERVVDADRDGELVDVIERLLEDAPATGADSRLDDLPRIHDFLAQRVGAMPHIGLLGRSAREMTTRLAGGLSVWALRLSMQPWRLRVQGTAGSGKTQLALQALQRAHQAGEAALYVCFNRPLADAMKRLAPEPSSVVTFHELARMVCEQVGGGIDFQQPDAFDILVRDFIALSPRLADTFDTLIIDEGQDFEPDWARSLIALARADARVLWLEDPEQSLYERPLAQLPGWVSLASPVNYRSPQTLIDFMNWLSLTEEPVQAGGSLRGSDPMWFVHEDDASPIPATDEAIAALLTQGYAAANIAVLSFRGLAHSLLAGQDGPRRLADRSVRRQSGYDAQGNAVWTQGDLLVDTVFRFKGQAADAVVITEMDFAEFGLRERRRLFVALTRARLQAVLVTSERAARVLRRRLEGPTLPD